MSNLTQAFYAKKTENGDDSFSSTGDNLLDIFFMTSYFEKHLEEVHIGDSKEEEIFAMFIRDPRLGLGRRDLGRVLMRQSKCSPEAVVFAGRFDDLWESSKNDSRTLLDAAWLNYLFNECRKGNELAKKWMPRYASKNLLVARNFAEILGFNKQQYGHFVKCNTVENQMSRQKWEQINFEHVPSLASIKYIKAFQRHQSKRYAKYLEDVKSGKKKLNVACTNVYDIYRNRTSIDADLFYNKLEKISINCVPIVDVSGSMYNGEDSIGKALSIGKYLSDCSTYCPGEFLTFSNVPSLINQNEKSDYNSKIELIRYADWGGSTNLSAALEVLSKIKKELPDYIVILSDMEFNMGSSESKDSLMRDWKQRGISTKIIWWNFNSRSKTCPEMDEDGNVFISGYSPFLLKYLQEGFDGKKFLSKLLEEYKKNIPTL